MLIVFFKKNPFFLYWGRIWLQWIQGQGKWQLGRLENSDLPIRLVQQYNDILGQFLITPLAQGKIALSLGMANFNKSSRVVEASLLLCIISYIRHRETIQPFPLRKPSQTNLINSHSFFEGNPERCSFVRGLRISSRIHNFTKVKFPGFLFCGGNHKMKSVSNT